MKRGKKNTLTTIVKKNKPEFVSRHIPKHEVWILPLFVLCGLKKPQLQCDSLTIAEMFTPMDDPRELASISRDIESFAEESASENPDMFLSILTSGAMNFNEPFALESFYEENEDLLKKYEFDEFSISKYLYHGYNARNWYPETLKAFKETFRDYDIELFVKLFAITSPRNHFKTNLIHAKHAYELYKKGKKFENEGFLPSVVKILNDFRNGEFAFGKDSRNGRRKIMNFARAILGDKKAVVVDSWLMRAFNLHEEYEWRDKIVPFSPRITEYDLVENYILRLGEVSGFQPRQLVSMLWSSTKTLNSKHKSTSTSDVLKELGL